MIDKKRIINQITNFETLESLARSYAEIASGRMKKIRTSVLSNRDFLAEIDQVFQELRISYASQVKKLVKANRTSKSGEVTFLAHNGKTVICLLSANTGLYGDLMRSTFNAFLKDVREHPGCEVTIIGRLGLSFFLSVEPNRPYTYFDLPDYGNHQEKLGEIIRHLVQYEKMRVHFGKFKNVVYQEPAIFTISAETPLLTPTQEKASKETNYYIFEPKLEEILVFFETEMFTSMFDQTISESQLAKFASRMYAMDKASQNIKKEIKSARLELNRVHHRIANKRQVNSLASFLFK